MLLLCKNTETYPQHVLWYVHALHKSKYYRFFMAYIGLGMHRSSPQHLLAHADAWNTGFSCGIAQRIG